MNLFSDDSDKVMEDLGSVSSDYLIQCIEEGQVDKIRILLQNISPSTPGNSVLRSATRAIKHGENSSHISCQIFELILSDPRIDPMIDIDEIVLLASGLDRQLIDWMNADSFFSGKRIICWGSHASSMRTLISDLRVDLRRLDLHTLHIVMHVLRYDVADRANELIRLIQDNTGETITSEHLIRVLDDSNSIVFDELYSFLLKGFYPSQFSPWMSLLK